MRSFNLFKWNHSSSDVPVKRVISDICNNFELLSNILRPFVQFIEELGLDDNNCTYIILYFPEGSIDLKFDWEAIKQQYGIKTFTINYDYQEYPAFSILEPPRKVLIGKRIKIGFSVKI